MSDVRLLPDARSKRGEREVAKFLAEDVIQTKRKDVPMQETEIPMKQDLKPVKAETKKEKVKLLKKIDPETAKVLSQLREKANKKPFGRTIKDSEILACAIRLIQPEHIKELQEASYSEQDRLKMAHEDFQRKHGKITLDQFIGKLLRGEITRGATP